MVAKDLHAQHVCAGAWACQAAALARLFLASLSPLPGPALPLLGPATGPRVLRTLAWRASLLLARVFPFATSRHAFPSGLAEPLAEVLADLGGCLAEPFAHVLAHFGGSLAEPLADVFADLGGCLAQPLAHPFAVAFTAWGRGLVPHRPLWFLATGNGREKAQHEDQVFHQTVLRGEAAGNVLYGAHPTASVRAGAPAGRNTRWHERPAAPDRDSYLLSEASAARSSFFLCWSNQVRT